MAIELRKMKPFLGLREPLSGLSHFAGLILSLAGLGWLLYEASQLGGARHIISFLVFGLSLVLLYLSSTLYHCLVVEDAHVIKLKRFDHMMIFVLIAGTYTPICLLGIRDKWGWIFFAAIWMLAVIGMACKFFWLGMPRWVGVGLYLLMGWMGLFLLPKLAQTLPASAIWWLTSGGIVYSVGAIIYALKWPNVVSGVWEFHETWHLFVLGGSFCHFWAVRACL